MENKITPNGAEKDCAYEKCAQKLDGAEGTARKKKEPKIYEPKTLEEAMSEIKGSGDLTPFRQGVLTGLNLASLENEGAKVDGWGFHLFMKYFDLFEKDAEEHVDLFDYI